MLTLIKLSSVVKITLKFRLLLEKLINLHAPVKFYSICKYHVNQLQVTVKDILHGKCPLEVMLKVTLEKV